MHAELDRVVGHERFPTLEDRDDMPYLWNVVKEVMRIRLVSPMMFTHFADKDFTVHDTRNAEFTIPAGTMLHLHGWVPW